MKKLIGLVAESWNGWLADGGPRLAAALAYYTAFSLAPLLLLITMVGGFLYRDADQQLVNELIRLLPGSGEAAVRSLLEGAQSTPRRGAIATLLGLAALMLGATGVFGQLQDALNTIWNVTAPAPGGVLMFIKRRFVSLTMVLGTTFLLLVSLILSTALSAVVKSVEVFIVPGMAVILQIVNFSFSFAMTTTVFALIFKVVPDIRVRWRDAWIGGIVSGLLFTAGQLLLGYYLADPARLSVYGAFASLIVLLLWVYYSAQILLFGAEFAQAVSRQAESDVRSRPRKPRKS